MAEGEDLSDPNVPATLRSLFGDTILVGEGMVPTDIDTINGKGKVVGVYLSGHWCPPCKKFTPVLAEWYERFKQGPNADNFEIIFLSSDRNDIEFTRYFMTMPWCAVPFAESERKTMITKRYRLKGIPVLLLLKADTCDLISTDGRGIVTEDVDGEDFPWDPEPIQQTLRGPVLNKDGEEVPIESATEGKIIGLYFHALWSEPCTAFIDKLTSVYQQLKEKNVNFEIIFSSSDQTEEDFAESYARMPWYTIPYTDRRRKKSARLLQVEGVPTMVIVGQEGEIINYDANSDISNDPEGKNFPWYPKPVAEMMSDSVEIINEFPCILWFTDKSEKALTTAQKAMEPVSLEYHKTINRNEARNNGQLIHFFYGGHNKDEDEEETVGEQLRDFAELPDRTPLLVLLDIPNQTKYICDQSKITTEVVSDFLKGYKDETLAKEPLEL